MTSSRIGRKPITIPSGVEVKLHNQSLSIKGPKGQLSMTLHPFIQLNIEDKQICLSSAKNDQKITGATTKLYRSIVGTARANIQNLVQGVTQGFERRLTLVGVGYRAQAKGKSISLTLGFSHPSDYILPDGVTAETPTQTEIVLRSINNELVGQVAANIRKLRRPEPYKGKGVRHADEVVVIKETKK